LLIGLTLYARQPARGEYSHCDGDCDRDHAVSVDEVILLVNIALGTAPASACPILLQTPGIDYLVASVERSLSGCPATPTPTPTATPFPTRVVVYHLTEGSTLLYRSSPLPGPSPIIEPLSGTFTVVEASPPGPNEFFTFLLTSLEFQGGSRFTLAGNSGDITGLTLYRPVIGYMFASIVIDGEQVDLQGTGPVTFTSPPVFQGLEICGPSSFCDGIRQGTTSGYSVTIFASPEPED
jgi:hypothetical protein